MLRPLATTGDGGGGGGGGGAADEGDDAGAAAAEDEETLLIWVVRSSCNDRSSDVPCCEQHGHQEFVPSRTCDDTETVRRVYNIVPQGLRGLP